MIRPLLHRIAAVLVAGVVLSSCGYHLVGHGGGSGAIPSDVHTIGLIGSNASSIYMPLMRDRLQQAGYSVARAGEATLRLENRPESFVPSAYDRSGVATQYRLTISGSATLERDGEMIWKSGTITVQDEVFVTAGLASIEASRQQLAAELRKEWVRQVWSRLQSGF